MRRLVAVLAMLALAVCLFLPEARFTEDEDTVLLARTIYALGKEESYATKLKLGSVVMNRVENAWFPDDLGEVLSDPQQFPAGSRYDADSLRAAHELLTGRRALDGDALYYQAADASEPWGEAHRVDSAGNYNFYCESGNN
ncbi:MAG: cell wall hydrolase [Eubacteriales bacterium]|nr:cell wall hydrolase [Eubacteriales bacterium]